MHISIESRNPAYVTLTARPHRVGLLVPDIEGLPWQAAFAGALASQSRAWGGSGNLLFPLRPDTINSELFWALVELLDPDTWGVFAGSHRELEDLDPGTYAAWRGQLDAGLAGLPADAQNRAVAEAHAAPLVDVAIPEDLHRLLVRRGATLNHDGHMSNRGPWTGTGSPPYPAVDALALEGPLPEVLDLVVSGDDTQRLLLAAEFGALTPRAREELDELGVGRNRLQAQNSVEMMRWLYDVNVSPGRGPFALSECGLGWYQSRPGVGDAVTVVAGEDAWDFAFAYAMRRMRTWAFWVPETVFSTALERHTALHSLVWLAERMAAPLLVTSATDDAAMTAMAASLSAARGNGQAVVRPARWREVLPAAPNRLVVRDNIGRPEQHYLDNGMTPELRTPLPRMSDDPQKLRWMTDVTVRDWASARHPMLGETMLTRVFSEARVTASGLAYNPQAPFLSVGVSVEHSTLRPELRPLPLLGQLQEVCARAGWRCELSQKGQFAIATAEMFGGYPELCAALRDPDVGAVLAAYLDGGAEAPGKKLTDRRRYLSLADIAALNLQRPAESVLGELRARGVLRSGILLKCSRCRHTDWYRPRDTDPTFECSRCSRVQEADEAAWLTTAEPAWHYRMDEVVFQFLRHRGDLPALAAFERFDQTWRTTQLVPEVSLVDPSGQEREIDFAVTDGAALWLGEAFTDARYASSQRAEMTRLRRLLNAAEVLEARGVILASAAEAVADATAQRARTVFPGVWPQIELRGRTQQIPRPAQLLDDA